jgi:hypothetical protein
MYLAIMWCIPGHGDKADGHAIDALRRTALASSRGYRQVSVDIEREVRNVNWNDLGHVIYSMVIQPEHNVNMDTQDEPLAEHFERPVSESSAKMTLPLTYNVVRPFKLIHLSAIERARMIYA